MSQFHIAILTICIFIYSPVLATLLHLALRKGYFTRRSAMVILPSIGFIFGVASSFLTYLGFGLPILSSIFVGFTTAWQIFAIVYIWTENAEHFWGTVILAGLMAMTSGPSGLLIVRAIVGPAAQNWVSVSWSIPFFVLGALTHIILRASVPPGETGYYRLTIGRVLLVLTLAPLSAMLSWCTSALTFGYQFMP